MVTSDLVMFGLVSTETVKQGLTQFKVNKIKQKSLHSIIVIAYFQLSGSCLLYFLLVKLKQ